MERPDEFEMAGAVIAAAGRGQRFGSPKQYLELAGRPLLLWSLETLTCLHEVQEIVVVFPPDDLARGRALVTAWEEKCAAAQRSTLSLRAIAGGERRQDSVERGLEAFSEDVRLALVHDAARPLVRVKDVQAVLQAVKSHGAAAIGHPSFDSMKRVRGGVIVDEVSRDDAWSVQTPQGARLDLLLRAYRENRDRECTDEAMALRLAGVGVALVRGPRENIKITRPGDERLAEEILRSREGGAARDSLT